MIKDTTVGDTIAKKSYFEKLSIGYYPIILLHPFDVRYIYKHGVMPKKLKQLHNIYTLR
jgi:hypothetical protein